MTLEKEPYKFQNDWCHAGGLKNFADIGHQTDHLNYGWPHVVGWVTFEETEVFSKDCILCGRAFE